MKRLQARDHVWCALWLVTLVLLLPAASAFAQVTSTLNGRVLDQGDAVLPGVTVVVTNENTGVVRTAVTSAEGVYYMPGLDPGVYGVRTDLQGFAPSVREHVTLAINATITIDFKLNLAGVEESVTVTGDAPLIEATQSKVAATIEATELQNLPMISRTISSMLALLPGAAPVEELHRTKTNVGTVSIGGSVGSNMIPTVDGADNRDNHYGGPLMSFSTDSIEQFQLATSQFTAADGRTAGAALTLITKSGTNLISGSGFAFARDRKLTAKDFFSKRDNLVKVPYSRQQFGGSVGGPIVRNRMFFFGAIEQMRENTGEPVPDVYFNELELLVNAERAGLIPKGRVNPDHPRFGDRNGRLRMMSVKSNAQLSNTQSLMGRYATQRDTKDAVSWGQSNDKLEQENTIITGQSGVVQHNWVLGNTGLNQLTGQVNHLLWLGDAVSNLTGEHYLRDFPNVDVHGPNLSFPTVSTGGPVGAQSDRYTIQIKEDLSLQSGNHAIRLGANYNNLPNLGIKNSNNVFATFQFFDDPSVILSNSNGRYPQGFQTPGIVRSWNQANGGVVNGVGYLTDTTTDVTQFGTWFQDDWRATQKLTLNLGVRWDIDYNLMDQENHHQNATRVILETIGNPYGGIPKKTRTKNISPRVGFAYDLSGVGARVLRGGYGLYFDQYNTGTAAGDITSHSRRPLNGVRTLTNTNYGVGQMATYRFGIDPFPAAPTEGNELTVGATGQWLDPDYVDPRSHHAHIGYAHTLAENTVVQVDVTHIEGRKEFRVLNINPIVNNVRVMAPAFVQAFGVANRLGPVNIRASINKSRYSAMTVRFQRRFPRASFQAHYTLAGAFSYGGSTGNRSGANAPQDAFDPFAPGEWGPNGPDERHRLVATGVFELPYGVQLSPILQLASARPYNLTAGVDVNADGQNNDRWVDPATGQQVSLNSARGDRTFVVDLRSTKFFALGGARRIGVFAEAFNVFNTINHGGAYNGNARSPLFQQPTGFMPSIGYPRQLQLGARYLF